MGMTEKELTEHYLDGDHYMRCLSEGCRRIFYHVGTVNEVYGAWADGVCNACRVEIEKLVVNDKPYTAKQRLKYKGLLTDQVPDGIIDAVEDARPEDDEEDE